MKGCSPVPLSKSTTLFLMSAVSTLRWTHKAMDATEHKDEITFSAVARQLCRFRRAASFSMFARRKKIYICEYILLLLVSCSATNYTRCWEQTASGVESRMCGTVPRACERARLQRSALTGAGGMLGASLRSGCQSVDLLENPANFFFFFFWLIHFARHSPAKAKSCQVKSGIWGCVSSRSWSQRMGTLPTSLRQQHASNLPWLISIIYWPFSAQLRRFRCVIGRFPVGPPALLRKEAFNGLQTAFSKTLKDLKTSASYILL